jgi:membrane protein
MRAAARLVHQTAARWAHDRCDRLAASLSFYGLFSLFPLALLSLTAFGFVLGDDAESRARVVHALAVTGSPELRALLDQALAGMQAHTTARGVGAIVGLATLVFGASAVFAELQNAFDVVWRVPPPAPSTGLMGAVRAILTVKARAFALVVAASLVLLASLVASTVLAAVGQSGEAAIPVSALWHGLELLASWAFVAPVLAVMFRVLPRAPVTWRDVIWGAVVTAFLLSILKKLLAYYLAHVGHYAAYGVAGAVLGLLMWIYTSSMVLFFGAELVHVYSELFGSLSPRRASSGGTVREPGGGPSLHAPTRSRARRPPRARAGSPGTGDPSPRHR